MKPCELQPYSLKLCLEDFHGLSLYVLPAGTELEACLHPWACPTYEAFQLYMVSTVYTVYVFALAELGSTIVHLCSAVMVCL